MAKVPDQQAFQLSTFFPQENQRPFLKEWLEALGMIKADLVRAGVVSPGYATQLCEPETYTTKAPKLAKVQKIAAAMQMPWQLLYRLPPGESIPRSEANLWPPDLIARIELAKRERASRAKRKYQRRA